LECIKRSCARAPTQPPASYAQFVGRNYSEAMRLAREGIRQRGDFVGAHRVLTAAAGMAQQDELARSALEALRRV